MTVQDPRRGAMVTLHCPRCRTPAAPGATDPIVECRTCNMHYTADDGARTAPPGEITRTRLPDLGSVEATVTVSGDTVTIVAPSSRHQRLVAPIVAIGMTAIAIGIVASLSEYSASSVLLALICALTWYAAIGATRNLNTIEIDAEQVTARVRPAPVTRRQITSRAAARHARTRSYQVRGTEFHCVIVDDEGRAIPLAYTASASDAAVVAELIRSHAAA